MEIKICKKCGLSKPLNEFSKNQRKCKACDRAYATANKNRIKEYKKQHYQDNKSTIIKNNKDNYELNKVEILNKQKEYYLENKDVVKARVKEYRENNYQKVQEYQIEYYENNRDNIRKYRNLWTKNKIKSDITFKLRRNVSREVYTVLKQLKRKRSIINYLPYSFQELKEHLESQFEPWMTWSNWGKYNPKIWNDNDQTTWTWNIDHIIPHSTFQYISMEDDNFQKCWDLENLRPLSAKQNVLDGNRRGI